MMKGGVKGVVLMGLLAMVATAAAAQDQEAECRCVDADGNELEDCVCVRTPRFEHMLVGPWGSGHEGPRLGISVDVAEARDTPEGARVTGVLEDGPAVRGGLREDDVVTHLDGRSLLDPLEDERERALDPGRSLPAQRLLVLARDVEPGDSVRVTYLRDGEIRTATLEAENLSRSRGWAGPVSPEWDAEAFGERMRALSDRMRELHERIDVRPPNMPHGPGPDAMVVPPGALRFRFRGPGPGPESGGDGASWLRLDRVGWLGLELVEVNPDLGAYFGTDRGVLVAAVHRERGLGLQAGDVILEVAGRTVDHPERVRDILSTYDAGEEVSFRFRRDGRELNVSGRLGG